PKQRPGAKSAPGVFKLFSRTRLRLTGRAALPVESKFFVLRDSHAHVSASHRQAPGILGRAGLRTAPTLRHGSRSGHVAHRHVSARAGTRAMARGLRAAIAAAKGRPLRREPESTPPASSVSGRAQAVAD